MILPFTEEKWIIKDSGRLAGADNMAIDRNALHEMNQGYRRLPTLRFFEWIRPSLTYGHLMSLKEVNEWAIRLGGLPATQRPTGGGAVVHSIDELDLSLLWPRGRNFLPESPRLCYQTIHQLIHRALSEFLGSLKLFVKPNGSCAESPPHPRTAPRLSICFSEPVCNDIMMGEKKIVGGALRITRKAILYQGSIQLEEGFHVADLQRSLIDCFESLNSLPSS